MSDDTEIELDEDALTEAHVAVEDVLIDFRDSRISVHGRANGFVVREKDGSASPHMRLGTRDGLRIAIKAYLKAVEEKSALPNAPIKPRRVLVLVLRDEGLRLGWCYGTTNTEHGDEVSVVLLDGDATLRTFHPSRVSYVE
jgi:hypothetical protein